jgi:hypothetical protein
MENVEILVEETAVNLQPAAPERASVIISPEECPTCVSGVDPSVGGSLFQEALREGL